MLAQSSAAQRGGAPPDSVAAADSSRRSVVARALTASDTIKAPVTRAYVPPASESFRQRRYWSREELFASGALTLAELLGQVSGATLHSAGFFLAPQVVAWHGRTDAVRVFIDGVERAEITPRNGPVADLSQVHLWALEDVTLEETAGELTVHARTWRVDRTTATTRTDVLTGSENLNLFRGYFGKRASNSLAIQAAAQQASTASSAGHDGDAFTTFARLGWTRGTWSVDATTLRNALNRNAGDRYPLSDRVKNALPAYRGTASTSYLRVGWRQTDSLGMWAQAIVASVGSGERPAASSSSGSAPPGSPSDSGGVADTTAAYAQQVLEVGLRRRQWAAVATLRNSTGDTVSGLAASVRGEWRGEGMTAAATVERTRSGTMDAALRVTSDLRAWAQAYATADRRGRVGAGAAGGTAVGLTAGLALRWRDYWAGGGVVRRPQAQVVPAIEFDTAQRTVSVAAASGVSFFGAGPVWRGWVVRSDVLRWQSAATFRPQMTARTRLSWVSRLEQRYPHANFKITASLIHEYRTAMYASSGDDPVGQTSPAFNAFGSLLEFRIGSAVVSWDYRNMAGTNYETFPGYLMPRITSVYGIRWEFWN